MPPSSSSLVLFLHRSRPFSSEAVELPSSQDFVPCTRLFREVVAGDALREGVEGNKEECARREEIVLCTFLICLHGRGCCGVGVGIGAICIG